MDVVRKVVPERAFQMQIEELELDDDINRALSRMENVGELMIRMLADEESLERMLKQGGAGDDAMEAIRYALDDLVVCAKTRWRRPKPNLRRNRPPLSRSSRLSRNRSPRSKPVPVEAELVEVTQAAVSDEETVLLPAFGDVRPEEIKPARAARRRAAARWRRVDEPEESKTARS